MQIKSLRMYFNYILVNYIYSKFFFFLGWSEMQFIEAEFKKKKVNLPIHIIQHLILPITVEWRLFQPGAVALVKRSTGQTAALVSVCVGFLCAARWCRR